MQPMTWKQIYLVLNPLLVKCWTLQTVYCRNCLFKRVICKDRKLSNHLHCLVKNKKFWISLKRLPGNFITAISRFIQIMVSFLEKNCGKFFEKISRFLEIIKSHYSNLPSFLFYLQNVTLTTHSNPSSMQDACYIWNHNGPCSPWSLCGSMVANQSAESEDLRLDFSRGFRSFSLSHARDKTKKHLSLKWDLCLFRTENWASFRDFCIQAEACT